MILNKRCVFDAKKIRTDKISGIFRLGFSGIFFGNILENSRNYFYGTEIPKTYFPGKSNFFSNRVTKY